jgi:hypothetical protein
VRKNIGKKPDEIAESDFEFKDYIKQGKKADKKKNTIEDNETCKKRSKHLCRNVAVEKVREVSDCTHEAAISARII